MYTHTTMHMLILAVVASATMEAPFELEGLTEAKLVGHYSNWTGFTCWSVRLNARGQYHGNFVDDAIISGERSGDYKGRWRYVQDVVKLSELKKGRWAVEHTLIPVQWDGVLHLVPIDQKGAFSRRVKEFRSEQERTKNAVFLVSSDFLRRGGRSPEGPKQILVPHRFLKEFTALMGK
jgi:hypothetical protein